MPDLPNPVEPGPWTFDRVTYAAEGLDYGSTPDREQYEVYEAPTSGFTSRRIDLSPFADLGPFLAWPFSNEDVPLNGHACIPHGPGPFPLAVFAHGNVDDPSLNSTPGYLYLCELLASHGIAAATIDANFLNGGNFGENDGRAIVHLEHVRQFALWNEQPGHPLRGRIDLDRVMLVGHSRGGEAVGHASVFNRLEAVEQLGDFPPIPLDGTAGLGPYGFAIRAAVAIAPTDGQYLPVTGPTRVAANYLVMHGSRDNDVYSFRGYGIYDRAHPLDPARPEAPASGYKGLLWVHRANHNFFNSAWPQEATAPTLSRAEQEAIAKLYINSFALAELRGAAGYLDVLRDHRFAAAAGWLPTGVTLTSQFQPARRLFLQHFEEEGDSLVVSAPATGTVSHEGVTVRKMGFRLGITGHLFQGTSGLRVAWDGQPGRYEIEIEPSPLEVDGFARIAFRVGQSSEPENAVGAAQDFTITFEDELNRVSVPVGSLQELVYPDVFPELRTEPKTVMQTVSLELEALRGVGLATSRLRKIVLSFDRTSAGVLYLDDIQLSD